MLVKLPDIPSESIFTDRLMMQTETSSSSEARRQSLRAVKVAGIYAVFGLLWILFSDQLLLLVTNDANSLAQLQTLKGWLFIVVTAALLFLLVRQVLAAQSRGQSSLRQSEQRFRTLLNTIPDLIWLKDADGVYLSCNSTFERFFGAKEADIVGKTDYDFVDRQLADFFRDNDYKAMMAGKPTSNEEWITFADDGYRALLLTTKMPMHGADGHIIGVLGVGRDISTLRQAEEERANLESQLQQARKIESIGQLAGGVAHDFNNMLGVILGHTELALKKAEKAKPVDSNLREIQKAAKHSAELTRQLLTFARKQAIAPKVLDLNETVAGMLKMLQRLIGENIQLTWNPAPQLWPICIDPSQVDQVLANLCVNARDAITDNGHIIIKTGHCTFDERYTASRPYAVQPGDYVQLSVSDDGCGMDKDVQARIFEPFYTTKGLGSGTGLGLATVYGAIKQNNGFITFYSEPGHGTVFNIYLPRVNATGQAAPEATEKPNYRGTETILLVEDEEMLLQMETAMLKESGYQVLVAATTDLALSLAQNHPCQIDLLVTDLIMPVMNGRELSAKLQPLRPAMKVLFMSGYSADIISRQGVIEAGVHFLQKPVSIDSLTAKVREVLDASD